MKEKQQFEVIASYTDEGVSFRTTKSIEELTDDERIAFDQACILVEDGKPTHTLMGVIQRWPVSMHQGLLLELEKLGVVPAKKEGLRVTFKAPDDSLEEAVVYAMSTNQNLWGSFWVSSNRYREFVFDFGLPTTVVAEPTAKPLDSDF